MRLRRLTGQPRLAGPLAALAIAVGGCGDDPRQEARDRVDAYVQRQQELMRGAQPGVEQANRIYVAFARGELPAATAARDVAAAGRTLRAARDRVLALDVPAEATRLHAGLARYLDLNVEIARETAHLARYGPAAAVALGPLGDANRRLQTRLEAGGGAEAQERALRAYTTALGAGIRRLRALRPPGILDPAHGDQIRRLAATAQLSGALREALDEQDAGRVARLLARFRRAAADHGPGRLALAQARAGYERQLARLDGAYAEIRRAEQRLDRELR